MNGGFWPRAGDVIVFEGGEYIAITTSVQWKSYVGGDGSKWDSWPPPVTKKRGKVVQVLRMNAEEVDL